MALDPTDPMVGLLVELEAHRRRVDADLGPAASLIPTIAAKLRAMRPPTRRPWREVLGGAWLKLPRRVLLAQAIRRAMRRADELLAAKDEVGIVEVLWAMADAEDELGGRARA
jgi:hypothetical protein